MLVCTLTHIAYDLLPIKFKIIYICSSSHTHTLEHRHAVSHRINLPMRRPYLCRRHNRLVRLSLPKSKCCSIIEIEPTTISCELPFRAIY